MQVYLHQYLTYILRISFTYSTQGTRKNVWMTVDKLQAERTDLNRLFATFFKGTTSLNG